MLPHRPASVIPALLPNVVQVWAVPLTSLFDEEFITASLSAAERHKAGQLVLDVHRRRYLQARAALRWLLAQHTGEPAKALDLRADDNGKPYLNQSAIQFNLSHSEAYAVIACSCHAALGVDVERRRPVQNQDALARECFSAWEYDLYDACAGPVRREVFFRGWTGKEAFSKALGLGLSFPFQQAEFMLDPDQPFALQRLRGSEAAARQWRAWRVDLFPECALSVVVENPQATIEVRWMADFVRPELHVR